MSTIPFVTYNAETNIYFVEVGVTIADLNTVIDSASAGATFRFDSGTFVLDDVLYVKRSDIKLEGAGSADLDGTDPDAGQTVFVAPEHLTNDAIVIKGDVDSSFQTQLINKDAPAGSYQIEVADGSAIQVGDMLHIQQDNYSDDFLNDPIYANIVDLPATEYSPLRETIAEVESVNGNIITLKQPLGYEVNAELTEVTRILPLDNVSFSGFKITYDLPGSPDDDSFQNPLSDFKSSAALSIRDTRGIDVHDIFIENAASHALEINDSLHANINGLTVDGAWNKGGGGNGYALHIKGTSYSTFDNLTLTDTRHAVVFSSWDAETNNDIHVLYTNRDINYHGSADHSNYVEVDVVDYDANEDKAWTIIDTGGEMHPHTDIYDNTTLFTYASAGDRDDIIFGTHNGATLLGNNGNDTLIGGDGDDYLSGGMDDDVMTGGTGADTYLMRLEEGQDIITDFAAEDKIILQDYYGFNTLDDLQIVQSGADTVITLAAYEEYYNSITLENFTAAMLTNENFIFEDTGNTPQSAQRQWTSLKEFIKTGEGDDFATGYFTDLTKDDLVDLGGGKDTISFISSSYNFDTTGFSNLKGVDIFDATQSTRARFVLTDDLLENTDNGTLKILHGTAGIERLDTSLLSHDYTVVTEGAGDVYLAHEGSRVEISENSSGFVYGGSGNDVIANAGGSVEVFGEVGSDTLRSIGVHNDVFHGGSDNDALHGEGGDDTLYGDDGDDDIDGGDGDDTIIGGDGNDTLTGGAGADIYEMSILEGHDTITDFAADDKIKLHDYYGADALENLHIVQSGLDTVITLAAYDGYYNSITLQNYSATDLTADNFIFDNSATTATSADLKWTSLWDVIITGNGNDRAYGYFSDITADDVMDLGAGYDTIQFLTTNYSFDTTHFKNLAGIDEIDATNSVRARFDLTDALVGTSDNGVLKIIYAENGIERLNTSGVSAAYTVALEGAGDVYLDDFGNAIDILAPSVGIFYGGAGNDEFTNFSDMIEIYAGDGDDIFTGKNLTNDVFHGGDGNDLIKGEAGDDVLYGDAGDDVIRGHAGNDYINGGGGHDLLEGYSGDDEIYGGGGNDEIHGHTGIDDIYGGAGDDLIYGQEDNDTLRGGSGNDAIYGGYLYSDRFESDDTIYGDEGEDILHGLHGNDTIDGGADNDVLYGGDGDDILLGGEGSDSIRGDRGNDYIDGGAGDDLFLSGNRGDDIVHGGDGNDVVAGSEGQDYVYGDAGDDIVKGEDGNDYVYGGDGNDDVRGHAGHDKLFGDAGNDLLTGYSDHDELNGGAGADTLYGHSGWDLFIFSQDGLDGTYDRIMDFDPVMDRGIKLENILSFDPLADELSDFVQMTRTSDTSYDLLIDSDGGGDTFVKIFQLDNIAQSDLTAESLYNDGKLIIV